MHVKSCKVTASEPSESERLHFLVCGRVDRQGSGRTMDRCDSGCGGGG